MNLLIYDDNPSTIEKLTYLIHHQFSNKLSIKQIDIKNHYQDLLLHYDLIFIHASNLSFIQTCKHIRSFYPDALLIIYGSNPSFVYHSFNFQCFYYLRESSLFHDFKQFTHTLENYLYQENQSITIHYQYQEIKIPYKHILYIESSGHDIYFHTFHKVFKTRYPLSTLINDLPDSLFIQIQQSLIVSYAHIMDIKQDTITLSTGDTFKINRYFKDKKETIIDYLSNGISSKEAM